MDELSTTTVEKTTPGVQVPKPIVMSRASSLHDFPTGGQSDSSTSLAGNTRPSRASSTSDVPPTPSSPNGKSSSETSVFQGGILSAPLAWVQKNRETRRRLQLQHEAEEQLRKIAEAEGISRHKHHHDHHQHPTSVSTTGSPDSLESDSLDEGYKIGTQHLSKSGEGMTAELDLVDEEDEYMIPPVRIHSERLTISTKASEEEEAPESPRKNTFQTPEYLLSPEEMHQIAIHVLPKTIAYCQWRRLYSLNRDGDSFDGCLRIISNVSRTLVVVRTTKGAVFGGYADSPWRPMELAKFYGSAQACLFSVKEPDVPFTQVQNPKSLLNVYRWTGKNRYIQLCDTSSKMLAFGGGGSDGAFGLCIEEDFQTGSTGPCDTFDNAPLCDESTFKVVDVEIWEFLTGIF